MEPLLSQAAGAVALLLLACLAGYAPSRWLLPTALHPWFWLAVPLIGLATLAVALGWLGIFLPLTIAVWVLLAIAVVADVFTAIRRGIAPPDQAMRETLVVATLAIVGFAIALMPLWGRPDLLSIGPNWDTEIHLPLAEYQKSFPLGFSLDNPAGVAFPALPNPLLWRVNFFDPRWAGLAFTQWLAASGVLTGGGAHQQMAGTLALMFSLSLPSIFLFFRSAAGMSGVAGIVGTAAVTVNAATLWIVFWSFGQQASVLPLLPLALLMGWHALTTGERGAIVLGALSLGALLASFEPILLLYAPIIIAFAIVLTFSRPVKLTALGVSLAMAALSVLFVPWAYLRGIQRFLHGLEDGGVSGLTQGPDVVTFPPFNWALGLLPTPDSGLGGMMEAGTPTSILLGTVVRLVVFALMAVGIVSSVRSRNWPLVVCGLVLGAVLLAMRYGSPYPYGYQKMLASASFLLVGLLALGGAAMWESRPEASWTIPKRAGLAAGLAVFFAINMLSLPQLISSMRDQSTMAYGDLAVLERLVPEGASVEVSGEREYQGTKAGALAYFLRKTDLYGFLQTGYSTFFRKKTSGVYDYILLHNSESAPEELYKPENRIWEGLDLKLYATPKDVEFVSNAGAAISLPVVEASGGRGGASGLRLTRWDENGSPVFDGWSPPLLGVLAETTPPAGLYPELTRGENWEADIPSSTSAGNVSAPRNGFAGVSNVLVTLATFREQDTTILVNDVPRPVSLLRGIATYSVGTAATPAHVVVRNDGTVPVYVKSVIMRKTPQPQEVYKHTDATLLRWRVQPADKDLNFIIEYHGTGSQPTLDVYGQGNEHHLGWWTLPRSPANGNGRAYRLRLRPSAPEMTLQMVPQTGVVLPSWRGSPDPGNYQSYFNLWSGATILRSIPMAAFSLLENGTVTIDSRAGVIIG